MSQCVTTRTQIQTSSPIVRQSPDFTLNTAARNVRHPELGTRGDPSLFQVYPWRTGENLNAMIHSPVHMLRHMRLSCTDTGISGIRPEPILTKSGGKSCWSMLTVLLASAGRRLCVQGDMELILLLPLLAAPGASAPLHPGDNRQQFINMPPPAGCWVLGGAAADSGWTLLVPII